MKSLFPKASLLLLVMLTQATVQAADGAGNYAIWGVGQSSCHQFNRAQANQDTRQYKDYLLGYLTAFNTLSENTYNVAGNTKLEDINAWLSDYCQMHQIESYNRAIQQYVNDHFDERLTVPPGSGQGWGGKSKK